MKARWGQGIATEAALRAMEFFSCGAWEDDVVLLPCRGIYLDGRITAAHWAEKIG